MARAAQATELDLEAALAEAAAGRRVRCRRGRVVVAVVPVEDLELLQRLDDEADNAVAEEALAEPGTTPYEQVRRELGLG